MLHCASTAVVDSPLALEPGVLPTGATGAGVAQTQGFVCVPSSKGPPRGWFVIFRLAECRPWPCTADLASNRFSPTRRPRSTPCKLRGPALAAKPVPTSLPSSVSRTRSIGTERGSFTSTSASPPLMRSARFDSVRIWKSLCDGPPWWSSSSSSRSSAAPGGALAAWATAGASAVKASAARQVACSGQDFQARC